MGRQYAGRSSGGRLTAMCVRACLFLLFSSFRPEAKLTSGNLQLHPHYLLNSDKVTCQRKSCIQAFLFFLLSLSLSLFFSTPRVSGLQTNGPNKSGSLNMSCHCTLIPLSWGGEETRKTFPGCRYVSGSQKRKCRVGFLSLSLFHVLRALD